MIRRSLRARGRVQGVGFRYQVRKMAQRYQITGFVQNAPDGSVLIEAQGDEGFLDLFTQAVRNDAPFAKVRSLEQKTLSPHPEEKTFEVRASF
ncbi:hypothetical protein ABB02_01232 [Clostridiaceae bacterium JG1575]|nr:hypothetical protein ABB02_01232 [Clostridiaceae bacterium JG1575]